MVGLRDFGEAAWACEQLYNARLAQAPHVDEPLRCSPARRWTTWATGPRPSPPAAMARHRAAAGDAAADALRLDGVRLPIGAGAPPPAGRAGGGRAGSGSPKPPPAHQLDLTPAALDFEFDLGAEDPRRLRAAALSPLALRAARPAECRRPGLRPLPAVGASTAPRRQLVSSSTSATSPASPPLPRAGTCDGRGAAAVQRRRCWTSTWTRWRRPSRARSRRPRS